MNFYESFVNLDKNEVRKKRIIGDTTPVLNEGRPVLTSVWVPTTELLREYFIVPFYADIKLTGRTFPYVIRNLILLYSDENDIVYDPFLGTGTTLYEGYKLKRRVFGSDLNRELIDSFKKRWKKHVSNKIPTVCVADASTFLFEQSIDLIIMSFPWYLGWTFNKDDPDSMENAESLDEFLALSLKVYKNCFYYLKSGGFICNILGNPYKDGKYYPITLRMEEIIRKAGFNLHYQFWNLRCKAESLIFPWARSALDKKPKKACKGRIGWDVHEDILIAKKP